MNDIDSYPTSLLIQGTIPPDNTRNEQGSCHQEVSASTGKNTGVVLRPCSAWTCDPTSMFWCFVYLWRTLNVICYGRWVLRVAKNFDDSYLCFWLLFFHLASFFIFRYQLRSSCFCTAVAAVSSVIDRFLSVSPSANLMFFETLNVLDRGWLTYSGGTNRSCEL